MFDKSLSRALVLIKFACVSAALASACGCGRFDAGTNHPGLPTVATSGVWLPWWSCLVLLLFLLLGVVVLIVLWIKYQKNVFARTITTIVLALLTTQGVTLVSRFAASLKPTADGGWEFRSDAQFDLGAVDLATAIVCALGIICLTLIALRESRDEWHAGDYVERGRLSGAEFFEYIVTKISPFLVKSDVRSAARRPEDSPPPFDYSAVRWCCRFYIDPQSVQRRLKHLRKAIRDDISNLILSHPVRVTSFLAELAQQISPPTEKETADIVKRAKDKLQE
jgi:hypothetical protein